MGYKARHPQLGSVIWRGALVEFTSQREPSLSVFTIPHCRFCDKYYNREFYLTRHEEICPKKEVTDDDDDESSDKETETIEVPQQPEVTKEEQEEDEDEEEDESTDEEDEEEEEDDEEEEYDPWAYLKDKIENYTEDAWSERTSALTGIYKEYMVFFHQMKSDPIHQKVQNMMK